MIERFVHGWFAGAWVGWLIAVFYALGSPDDPMLGLIVLLAFLPIEALAVYMDSGLRDTFSEIFTWVQRKLSKHMHIARGWNAMLLLVILSITYLLGRTALHYSGSWVVAVVFFGLATVWLFDHLFNPQKHG